MFVGVGERRGLLVIWMGEPNSNPDIAVGGLLSVSLEEEKPPFARPLSIQGESCKAGPGERTRLPLTVEIGRSSISALWSPKSLDSIVDLDLTFEMEAERTVLRRQGLKATDAR